MHRRIAPVLVLVLAGLLPAVVGCTAAPSSAPSHMPRSAPPRLADEEAPDTWAHHFDDEAETRADSPFGVSWGSFGDSGSVTPVGNRYSSVPAGEHTVVVHCVGPTTITVTVTTADSAEPGRTSEVSCIDGMSSTYTTTAEGLDITVDSHGEQGAWLMDVAS